MRVFYDFEFLEHQVNYGHWPRRRSAWTVEPLSIGVKVEDGREFYAVWRDAPWHLVRKHEWLMDNVVPQLSRLAGDQRNHAPSSWLFNMAAPEVKPGWQIANELGTFLQGIPDIELWGWYCAFDHVSLAWIWGKMMDLPEGVPMYTNDLKQRCARLGNPNLNVQQQGEHNALEDARENERRAYQLDRLEKHMEAFEL